MFPLWFPYTRYPYDVIGDIQNAVHFPLPKIFKPILLNTLMVDGMEEIMVHKHLLPTDLLFFSKTHLYPIQFLSSKKIVIADILSEASAMTLVSSFEAIKDTKNYSSGLIKANDLIVTAETKYGMDYKIIPPETAVKCAEDPELLIKYANNFSIFATAKRESENHEDLYGKIEP